MRQIRMGLGYVSACVASLALALALPGVANAGTQPAVAVGTPAPETTAAELLRTGDAALDTGDRAGARAAFLRVVREFPASPEAVDARRVLRALTLEPGAPGAPPATTFSPAPAPNRDIVIRSEPYSLRTSERLRLTAWEKTDFGVTSFIYGASLGASLSIATHSDAASAVVLGAVAYTVGAVAFLGAANPDRGDLPLALGIVSYVPMTTLLVSAAAFPNTSSKSQAVATTVSSVLSVPIAVVAAQHLDLDPGDTQLVRDAGFWGLVLSVTGTMALGSRPYGGDVSGDESPSTRTIAVAGLAGLYGGLGLGLLAATHSEISLERVRVTTWGGYGGAVLGALIGASNSGGSDRSLWGGITIGSLCGLGLALITTSGLDGIPPETATVASAPASWAPIVTASATPTGQRLPVFGIGGNLF